MMSATPSGLVLAGGLVVADVRTDLETTQAWPSLNSQAILADNPLDVGAADVDWPYTPRSQDDHARRIFLTHWRAMPERYAGDRCRAPVAAKDNAEPPAPDSPSIPLACLPATIALPPAANSVGRGPTLVANPTGLPSPARTIVRQSRLAGRGTKDRLVANAGRWLAGDLHGSRTAAAGNPASAIVLADQSRRTNQPRASDITAVSNAPPEITCRGPPSPGGRSVGGAGNSPRPHHDIDVVDDLGRPAPIRVAELNVSRFFRDAFGLEFYLRKLAKHGVRLISITQELGDDPAQVMMR